MSKPECTNLYKLQSCYAEVTKKCQNILATHLHVKIPTSLLFKFRSEHYWRKPYYSEPNTLCFKADCSLILLGFKHLFRLLVQRHALHRYRNGMFNPAGCQLRCADQPPQKSKAGSLRDAAPARAGP